jgi:hypothetical protein
MDLVLAILRRGDYLTWSRHFFSCESQHRCIDHDTKERESLLEDSILYSDNENSSCISKGTSNLNCMILNGVKYNSYGVSEAYGT